jgi:RNA polymerase sigma-70 factor (ECF subfamily)
MSALNSCLESEGSTGMATTGRIDVDAVERDEALAAARAGDLGARWLTLEACRQYLRLVVGNNRWPRGADEPATSDLVQDTILEGWRGFARFKGSNQQQLRAWLRVTLIHSLIKLRRRPRLARLESGSGGGRIQGSITPASRVVERNASNQAIEAALRSLPEHYHAAIKWRLWDDVSFAEIGSRLGKSDDCAQKLYARAIARLRKMTGPGHEPE